MKTSNSRRTCPTSCFHGLCRHFSSSIIIPISTRLRVPSSLFLPPFWYSNLLLSCSALLPSGANRFHSCILLHAFAPAHNRSGLLFRKMAGTHPILTAASLLAWLSTLFPTLCSYFPSRLGRRFGCCVQIGSHELRGHVGRPGLDGPFLGSFATPSPSLLL
jgi:hypothetical protein